MEFVENKSFSEIVNNFNELKEQMCAIIERTFNETIRKMKETDDVEIRKNLFESFLFDYVKIDPHFMVVLIEIDHMFYSAKDSVFSYYFKRREIVYSFHIHINYQTMMILEEKREIELSYDNFMDYFFPNIELVDETEEEEEENWHSRI